MDSLSYVFLAYAAYATAVMILAPVRLWKALPYLLETREIRDSVLTAAVAAVLFVYLDIIIDPVALQGDRWFLGKIYGYPFGGLYFGVPLSNFGGWLLTGFVLVLVLQKIDSSLHRLRARDWSGHQYPWRYAIGPALYISVILFNLTITFLIGEYFMGWVGVFIALLPATLVCLLIRSKLQGRDVEAEWTAHVEDFPEVFAGSKANPQPEAGTGM